MSTADVEVILDVRQWRDELRGPEQFHQLWTMIESGLRGRDLASRPVHALGHQLGEVRVQIAWIRPGASTVVDGGTRFQISTVLDRPLVRYRCQRCTARGEARYGPFVCRTCGDSDRDNRLCDEHVSLLDGALIATCDAHIPGCAECGQPATFRCAGTSCRRSTAHCNRHRVTHPHDSDHAYCPSCYDRRFPRCEVASCRNIGASRCEVADTGLGQCGTQVCALHMRRWQVFGGEALGLGLCARHGAALPGYAPEELIRQIVVGTYNRATHRRDAEPLPSLQGLAHSLRNRGHREHALDYQWTYRVLTGLRDQFAADSSRERLRRMLQERMSGRTGPGNERGRSRKTWDQEIRDIGTSRSDGERLVSVLRELVRRTLRYDGEAAARSLALAEYKPPRTFHGETKPGLLFVRLGAAYRQGFIGTGGANIKYFGQQLSAHVPGGVTVRLEDDQRRGRR